tara:strand:+ start:957 stop:1679 length:723 start_codon:yes stop_codon:yes gene_type:complete
MKKVIFILSISLSFSQYFGGNISVGGALPQGEFKDQEVPNSFAIDINALYYINDYAAVGINLGGSQYGFTEREIPFNQWVAVGLIEETRNNMGYGNLLLKIIPFKGPVKIYGEGLIGLKNLNTTTKLFSQGNSCDDPETDIDECEIASDTNASDTAFGYGVGGGIEVVLTQMKDEGGNSSGTLSLIVSAKQLWGGDVQYLKKGGITVTPNGNDFPIINYNWNQSRTDVMHYNIGVHFTSK